MLEPHSVLGGGTWGVGAGEGPFPRAHIKCQPHELEVKVNGSSGGPSEPVCLSHVYAVCLSLVCLRDE